MVYCRQFIRKEGAATPDESPTPPPGGTVIEMPWVLLSNQIQQLNDNLNARLTEQKAYFDDHLAQVERRIDERLDEHDQRFAQLDRCFDEVDRCFEQIDQRFAQINHRFENIGQRFDAIDQRLAFRVSVWVTVTIAVLTTILGAQLAHVRF